MKRVFLTGGSGFVGSNLIPELIKENYDVYALTRYVSNRTPKYPKEVNVVYGDLRDSLLIKKLIKDISPEIVVHLGAISPVQQSFGHSQEVFEINTLGTMILADANLNNSNLEKFIFAGTSEMYGNSAMETLQPLNEHDVLKPNQPYAISKVAAFNYLNYLREAYNFPACTVRPFNTYGRTENFNFVTERIIWNMLTHDKEITMGNPKPVRDLLYIKDHVSGYMSLLKSDELLSTVNFCTGKMTSIKELAEKIAKILDWKGEIIWGRTMKRPTEIDVLVGSNELARLILDWKPKYSLDEGLKLTIEAIKKLKTCE